MHKHKDTLHNSTDCKEPIRPFVGLSEVLVDNLDIIRERIKDEFDEFASQRGLPENNNMVLVSYHFEQLIRYLKKLSKDVRG